MKSPIPPLNTAELLHRAWAVAGLNLQELALRANWTLPPGSLVHHKGWVGKLIEWHLGATGESKAQADFPKLGIELKTIPVDQQGRPLESTYVCTAPALASLHELYWEDSWLKRKLSHVLWLPLEGMRDKPIAERRLGAPLLWRPSLDIEQVLRQDWEELLSLLFLGEPAKIRAHYGRYLQLRPKAAHSRIVNTHYDSEGNLQVSTPKGFYLRTSFTSEILQHHYG